MTGRFWLPVESDNRGEELELVACVASGRCLYFLLEGEPLPPPTDPYSDEPELLWLRVFTASGNELRTLGGGGSHGKGVRPRHMLFNSGLPADMSEALTVRLFKGEDPVPVWEVRVVPVG